MQQRLPPAPHPLPAARLSPEELDTLALQLVRDGHKAAEERIVAGLTHMVFGILKRYRRRPFYREHREDLIGDGLAEAIALLREYRGEGRFSERLFPKLCYRVKHLAWRYMSKIGAHVARPSHGERLDLSAPVFRPPASLTREVWDPTTGKPGATLADLLPAPEHVDREREAREAKAELDVILFRAFTPREREILRRRRLRGEKLETVAERLQVSFQRIAQVEAAALGRSDASGRGLMAVA